MRSAGVVVAACLTVVASGCGDGGGATDGNLLLRVAYPGAVDPACCQPNLASVTYEVFCGADDEPSAAGELESTNENLWEGRVAALPPDECLVRLLGRDKDGEGYCSASEPIVTVPGEMEVSVNLICETSFGQRTDLTGPERSACFEAQSPCFLSGGFTHKRMFSQDECNTPTQP